MVHEVKLYMYKTDQHIYKHSGKAKIDPYAVENRQSDTPGYK